MYATAGLTSAHVGRTLTVQLVCLFVAEHTEEEAPCPSPYPHSPTHNTHYAIEQSVPTTGLRRMGI
jgi:hypothetical protein